MHRVKVLGTLLALAALGTIVPPERAGAQPASAPPGVVVEAVEPGLAAARSGLAPGDVLLAWRRDAPTPDRGELASPFDLTAVEVEQAPRGTVELVGRRAAEPFTRHLEPGAWGLATRPGWDPAELESYLRGRQLIKAGELPAGFEVWRELARGRGVSGRPDAAAWLLGEIAAAAARAGNWDTARTTLGEAARQLGTAVATARLHESLAAAFERANGPGEAADAWRRALELRATGSAAPAGLASAASLAGLGRLARQGGELTVAESHHQGALELRRRLAPESLAVAESLHDLGEAALESGALGRADELLREALGIAERLAPESPEVARFVHARGRAARKRGDLEAAKELLRRAFELRRHLRPDSLELADSLHGLGSLAWDRGDLEQAETRLERSLELRRRLRPGSLDLAKTLNSLGIVAGMRGELARAEKRFRDALTIYERLTPTSIGVSEVLNNLGIVAEQRGDLRLAQRLYRRSLAVQEQVAPDSQAVAAGLINLGNVALDRGDLMAAESFFRRALGISERLAPESLRVARTLQNLGDVAEARQDLAAADAYLRRALAIQEQLAPGSLDLATSLNSLGLLSRKRHDPRAAKEFFQRALAIRQRQAPASLFVAASLAELADLSLAGGEQERAEALFRQALAIQEAVAPTSHERAATLNGLGRVAAVRGDPAAAQRHHQTALELLSEVPGSLPEAAAHHGLATAAARQGHPRRALEHFQHALEALEAQSRRIGGSSETQASFGASYTHYYREALELALRLGETPLAFHLLERSRARGLSALLAERDLLFASDIPAELDRRRRRLNAEHDRLLGQLSGSAADSDEAARIELRRQLDDVRRRQREARAEVRAASPRLAALQYPEPLDLAAARRALDPGTLLLSYSIGEASGHLFLLGPGPREVRVHPLPIGRQELAGDVQRFRDAIRQSRDAGRVRRQAARLSELLLAPAAEPIGRARRLMILADGPLHLLPFAALADPGSDDRFLVEAKPLYAAASATVFAQLRGERRPAAAPRVVAFGDPAYPSGAGSGPELSSLLRGGLRLDPLPATRHEVESLRALFPESSRVYLGAEADEARAKSIGGEATLLHFACHGLIDERSPLDSALALAVPEDWQEGRENGLLQAWEIFEQVRLDAELVTLSACESGLGRELAGEGMLGLTRAFQFAGARSVLASLWAVGDDSTAELMRRFYGYLKAGESKADSLRHAQLDLLRGDVPGDVSHPFHWAAFSLVGDWR